MLIDLRPVPDIGKPTKENLRGLIEPFRTEILDDKYFFSYIEHRFFDERMSFNKMFISFECSQCKKLDITYKDWNSNFWIDVICVWRVKRFKVKRFK